MNVRYFLDVSILAGSDFTGIQNVSCEVVKWLRVHKSNSVFFYDQNGLIDPNDMALIINSRNGSLLLDRKKDNVNIDEAVLSDPHCITVGLFFGIKQRSYMFDYQAEIIYDLTYLVVPELHRQRTVLEWGRAVERDVLSNDLNICISDWTRRDLVDYVGADDAKCMVAHLGHDAGPVVARDDIEPYYLVLGSVEPRKNLGLVLRAFRDHPELLRHRKLVIAGRAGWGPTFAEMISGLQMEAMLGRQVYYLGYCSDAMREKLLRNARLLLYPSIYEGFGLPVLEAMAVGTPVITSCSSSLPEVGGNCAFYIHPDSVGELVTAVHAVEAVLADPVAAGRLEAGMRAHAARFTWDGFCSAFIGRIESDLAGRIVASRN